MSSNSSQRVPTQVTRSEQDSLRYKQLVHTPNEVSDEYIRHMRFRKECIESGNVTRFGVSSIDSVVIPFLPGDLVSFIARPGNLKSSLAAYVINYRAEQIVKLGDDNSCVVFVTLEQPVEEVERYFQANQKYTVTDLAWGRYEIEDLITSSVKRVGKPIITIGRSLERRKERLPSLTVETIYESLRSIERSFGKKPVLVVIDYIQKVSLSKYTDRTQQVTEAIFGIKDVAVDLGAPFIVNAQASREVDNYMSKIPKPNDCQHASAIEQESDKLFGLWRPWLTEEKLRNDPIGMPCRMPDGTVKNIKVTKELFIIKLLKQRWADAGNVFYTYFDPAAMTMFQVDFDTINL